MMRASASTQVSIDYTSEADAVRKMRIASALAPILGAIADNVAVYEREVGAYPLVRLAVWRNVDDDRCGVVPGVFKPGFGLERMPIGCFRPRPFSSMRNSRMEPS